MGRNSGPRDQSAIGRLGTRLVNMPLGVGPRAHGSIGPDATGRVVSIDGRRQPSWLLRQPPGVGGGRLCPDTALRPLGPGSCRVTQPRARCPWCARWTRGVGKLYIWVGWDEPACGLRAVWRRVRPMAEPCGCAEARPSAPWRASKHLHVSLGPVRPREVRHRSVWGRTGLGALEPAQWC